MSPKGWNPEVENHWLNRYGCLKWSRSFSLDFGLILPLSLPPSFAPPSSPFSSLYLSSLSLLLFFLPSSSTWNKSSVLTDVRCLKWVWSDEQTYLQAFYWAVLGLCYTSTLLLPEFPQLPAQPQQFQIRCPSHRLSSVTSTVQGHTSLLWVSRLLSAVPYMAAAGTLSLSLSQKISLPKYLIAHLLNYSEIMQKKRLSPKQCPKTPSPVSCLTFFQEWWFQDSSNTCPILFLGQCFSTRGSQPLGVGGVWRSFHRCHLRHNYLHYDSTSSKITIMK